MFSVPGAFAFELKQTEAGFSGSLTPAPLAWVADILARGCGPWCMVNRVAFVGRAPGPVEDLLPGTALGRAAVLALPRDAAEFLRRSDVRSAQIVDFRSKPPAKELRLMANAKWGAASTSRAAKFGSRLRATVVVESALVVESRSESILRGLVERGVQMHAVRVLTGAGRRPSRVGGLPDDVLYRIARVDASMSFPSAGAVLEGDRLYLPFTSGGAENGGLAGEVVYNRETERWTLATTQRRSSRG
jgi:hypothetical protein